VTRASGGLLAALLLGAAALAQEPPDPPEPGGGEKPPEEQGPPPQPVEGAEEEPGDGHATPVPEPAADAGERGTPPRVPWPLGLEDIEGHLRAIEAAHPAVAALEELGRSTGGRAILALRIGAGGAAERAARPTLLVADHLGPASAGAEAALALAWELCAAHDADPSLGALLARVTLVVAPALDPDRRAGPAGEPAVRFERNFPTGWQPETIRPGSGRTPLALRETLAAARFLAGLPGCALVLAFAPAAPRGMPYPGAELAAEDRDVFARLVAALELPESPPVVPWNELGSEGGGFLDFAYQARGIFPLVLVLPAEDELAAGAFPRFAAEIGARVRLALTLLPRLEVAAEGIERVASDTWQLDVRIHNAGLLPTASAQARRRALIPDVSLSLAGARLVATARRTKGGASYTDASLDVRGSLSGGLLSGGEERWLRLFLEAASGASVVVGANSSWAGDGSVQTVLP
jgi:hypothetical protein